MKHSFQATIYSSILLTCTFSQAGQYDALPLRRALSNEPHFQTSQGREHHRYEGAEINKYRLYDFTTKGNWKVNTDGTVELIPREGEETIWRFHSQL